MPAAHPKEFRDDVVAVARRGDAPIAEVAKDFGISESCLRNWMAQATTDEGGGSAGRLTSAEKKELAELRKKNRQLEVLRTANDRRSKATSASSDSATRK